MNPNKYSYKSNLLPIALILVILIAYAIMGFFIPPLADDLGFIEIYRAQNDCWYSFPRYVYRQWLWNNARMADLLNPIGFVLIPNWLQAISNGFVVGLMYYLTIRLSSQFYKKSPFLSVLIIFILTFAMRWDGIWMEYNTFYNYIWSSAYVMLALSYLFSDLSKSGKWYCWLFLPFCFIACAMHEAIGAPLAASLIFFLIVTPFYREANLIRRLTVIVMILGGLFTVTSPASYSRIGTMLQPESPLLIVLGSAIFVLILLLFCLYMFLFRKSILYSLICSKWIVFVGISILSSGFMLLSGYGGRTGWFAQIFAIIAIFLIINELKISVGSRFGWLCSILMSCLIVCHIMILAKWQYRLAKETREVIADYKKAVDGIVYYDYTGDKELPWYLFRKPHGVPDDDDSFYRYRMQKYYGNGKQLVILPKAFYPIPDSLSKPIVSGQFILSSRKPTEVYGDTIVSQYPREITYIDGKEYIINNFEYKGHPLYLLSEMDRDRGEK